MCKDHDIAITLTPRLLDRGRMAECISVSESTLDALRERGLPSITVPGTKKRLFDPDDVVAWLKGQAAPQESLSQATAQAKADAVFGN